MSDSLRNTRQDAHAGAGATVAPGSDVGADRSQSEAGGPQSGGSEGGSAPLPRPQAGSRLDTDERVRILERSRERAAILARETKGKSLTTGANQGALDIGPVFHATASRRSRTVQFCLDAARQLTFGAYDGTARVEPAAYDLVGDPDADPSPATPAQLERAGQLRLFPLGGVSMPADDWTDQYSLALDAWSVALGRGTKRGRSMARRAISARACGMFCERRVCACGKCQVCRRVTLCNTRACIRGCAKVNADATRLALERTMLGLKERRYVHVQPSGRAEPYTAFMLTVTIAANPLDPRDMHPDALKRRQLAATRAMRRIGDEVLRVDSVGHRRRVAGCHWRTEVSLGGNVHLHGALWSVTVSREELERMRAIVREESPTGRGNIDYRVMRRKRRKDGTYTDPLKECAKYVTKGSSPKRSIGKYARSVPSIRMHPVLAATVELAFCGMQLEGGWGTLRHIERDAKELEATAEEVESPGDDQDKAYCADCGVLPAFVAYVPVWSVREIHGVCKARPLGEQERKDAHYLARSERATDAEAARDRMRRWSSRGPPLPRPDG